ncbi:winged helix-turn-helix domain-containing protein [Nakamurella sp.]|uniref:winged helix-turn-helix domain-containing protein n=1 Tax=Nakamurella sp. TaxID=1869182 RepID=UPI003783FA78
MLALTAGQARRIAISAQQLASPQPDEARPVNRGHLRRLVDTIGLLQIDSVNVLARAHLLPLFSRLGPYPTGLLEGAAWPIQNRDRLLVESWAHMASLIPVEREPLLRWRQREREVDGPWGMLKRLQAEHPGFLDVVLDAIRDLGPSSAGDIERALEAPGRDVAGWWEWSITKIACEHLFMVGAIGVTRRRGFERVFDLTERVLPAGVAAAATPAEPDAKRELVALAARAHGIGTVADLADYYRMGIADTRRALADLVEDGRVRPVEVRGWDQPAFLHREARLPRAVDGAALLSPFDPLVWRRERTERLFGMHYRIEIYTPAAKRVYGYYVLPLLVGDSLAGRFDLKADRAAGRLLVQASWSEPGADLAPMLEVAATELRRMARWLDLPELVVVPRGNLAAALSRHPSLARGG